MRTTRLDARLIQEHGYQVLDSVDSDQLLKIAQGLGPIRLEKRDPRPIREISPQDHADARVNTLSSRHGLDGFPPHTDTVYWRQPAKFVLLRCENVGSGTRPTVVWDTHALQFTEDEKSMMCRAKFVVRASRPFLASLLKIAADGLHFRLDNACMIPRTSDAPAAISIIREKLMKVPGTRIQWTRGRVLVLENRRCIHARGVSSVCDKDRILQKVLVGS